MDKLQPLVNLIKSLSWTKVAELAVLIVLLIAALTFYENRQAVYDTIGASSLMDHSAAIVVTEKTKSELENMIDRSKIILGVHVAEVSFIKNTRHTAYLHIDDPILKKAFEAYFKSKMSDAPALTALEGDNTRLVRLVNNEFVCVPYKDTIGYTLVGGGDNVGMACSVAIPPYYGKFRGYITAFVSKEISTTELSQVRIVLQVMAMNIYDGK